MIIQPEKFTPFVSKGMSIIDLTEEIDGNLSIARISLMPGGRQCRTLSPKSDKYYYVLFGRIVFSIQGFAHQLKAGELCFIPKGDGYAYTNASQEPVEMLLIIPDKFTPEEEAGK